jgi:hypothetical protein
MATLGGLSSGWRIALRFRSPRIAAAVIKDARRRARRRRLRTGAVVLAAGLAAASYAENIGRDTPRPSVATGHAVAIGTPGVALAGTPIQGLSADGSVWVLTCNWSCASIQHSSGQLVRVSSLSGRVTGRILVSNPQAFVIGAGAIWIAHFWSGTVTRVDPATGATTKSVSLVLPKPYFGRDRRFLPYSISIGNGAVWVATARGWLAEISETTGRLEAMLPAPHETTGQVVGGSRGTWVAESTLGLGLVRPPAHRLELRSITDSRHRLLAIDQVAIGGGRLWSYGMTTRGTSAGAILTNGAAITALDERTGKISRQMAFPAGPYDLAYADGALFLANLQNGRVVRVNRDYTIHRLRSIRPAGKLVTITAGAIWTVTRAGRLQRTRLP